MNESLSGGSNAARLNTQNTDSIPAPSTPPTLATSSLPPSGLPDARIPDSSRQVAADTKTSESISIAPRTPPALEALLQNSQALQNGSNLHERRLSRNLGLQVQTDLQTPPRPALTLSALEGALPSQDTAIEPPSADHLSPLPAGGSSLPSMSSYFNALHASHSFDNASSYSPASALPSPALSAMIDITPLPSPIYPGSGTPKRSLSNARSRRSSLGIRPLQDGVSRSNSVNSQCTSPRKKKHYGGLLPASMGGHAPHMAMAMATSGDQSHGRSRSVSDFVPETLQNVRQRVVTLGATPMSLDERVDGGHLHREEYVAAKRGLVERHVEIKHLPSPPPSNRSTVDSEMEDDDDEAPDQPGVEYFRAVVGPDRRKRKWRSLKLIGKGTFSKVYLATSQHILPGATTDEQLLNPTKLVAVKICEHGPAGGADEQRIKHSLDREISILKSVSHPSIVRLKAMSEAPGRTELIMSFCKGGDLFEFASERRDLLRIELIQRMFAELVAATAYLHQNLIVHRDIKLENVLVNAPAALLTATAILTPSTHPFPIVTLTDLGLSRRIAPPPASPLLTTRCGSEDYAAPELLLGQPYDGRSTDAWALGVLLYALLEGRLPFDAPPGKPDRSKNTHRIARCDWIWSRFGDQHGDWDPVRGIGWEGPRKVVEACLRKVRNGRTSTDKLLEDPWVQAGIKVPGGLRREVDDGVNEVFDMEGVTTVMMEE